MEIYGWKEGDWKMKKSKYKFDKLFLLSWRNIWVVVVLGFVSILLHNFWYGIFGFEEAVFFSIVIFIIPLYLIISIIYTIHLRINRGK